MNSKPKLSPSTRSSRDTDETTVGSVDAFTKQRLDRQARELACLVVIAGSAIGDKIPLAADRLVIGRQSHADICFDDGLVSRNHAEILVQKDGGAVIRDLGSRNGTYCNERRITQEVLKDGDLLRIGGSVLKYLGPDSAENVYVSVMADRARLDGLTGLCNRRTFQEYLDRIFSRCRNLGEPLSLIVADLDFFKRVNDEWGHLAGDYVLQEIAALLKNSFRPTDLFARYGGEELGLILPYTTAKEAAVVGERMRTSVAAHEFVFEGRRISVTISLGVAELADNVGTPDVLLARSDKALYVAKQQGRNRTVCFADSL